MATFKMTTIRKGTRANTGSAGIKAPLLTWSALDEIHAVAGLNIIIYDDGGVHNTLDSIVGQDLTMKTGFPETVFFAGRRVSSEILSRALRCHMPVVAASEVPADQAMERARQANSTPIGRVEGNRMSAYGRELRIC